MFWHDDDKDKEFKATISGVLIIVLVYILLTEGVIL